MEEIERIKVENERMRKSLIAIAEMVSPKGRKEKMDTLSEENKWAAYPCIVGAIGSEAMYGLFGKEYLLRCTDKDKFDMLYKAEKSGEKKCGRDV